MIYTRLRHSYLKALVQVGQRPRIRSKVGFALMECGLVAWLYPAPDGSLLEGVEARERFPSEWDGMRSLALEKPTHDGILQMALWDRGIKN